MYWHGWSKVIMPKKSNLKWVRDFVVNVSDMLAKCQNCQWMLVNFTNKPKMYHRFHSNGTQSCDIFLYIECIRAKKIWQFLFLNAFLSTSPQEEHKVYMKNKNALRINFSLFFLLSTKMSLTCWMCHTVSILQLTISKLKLPTKVRNVASIRAVNPNLTMIQLLKLQVSILTKNGCI